MIKAINQVVGFGRLHFGNVTLRRFSLSLFRAPACVQVCWLRGGILYSACDFQPKECNVRMDEVLRYAASQQLFVAISILGIQPTFTNRRKNSRGFQMDGCKTAGQRLSFFHITKILSSFDQTDCLMTNRWLNWQWISSISYANLMLMLYMNYVNVFVLVL